MQVQGKIKLIQETVQVSDSFRKRGVVVTTEEQYPQHLLIEFVQDKCDHLDIFNEGEVVTIGINLRGREWTSPSGEVKYFNTVQGWKIERVANAATAAPQPEPAPATPLTDEDEPPF